MSMPEAAPFVVRNQTQRFVIQSVAGLVFVIVGVVLLFTGLVTAGLILILPGAAILALSVMSLRNRGPLLTADAQGVPVQAFPGPDGVRVLPWTAVERVYVHRVARQFRLLCVLPRDVAAELAAFPGQHAETLRSSVATCGAPYSVNLVAAGISDEQAGRALHALAAGRAHIDLPAV